MRELVASHYGAPTIRKRLYIVARCDGSPIVWPAPTHGYGLRPLRSAAECLDWHIPCPSIFLTSQEARPLGVTRPLADKTMARIARGIKRYVLDTTKPFIVGKQPYSPSLVQTGYGEREGQLPRSLDIGRPLGTIVAGGVKHALVAAFLVKNMTDNAPRSVQDPLSTILTGGHHILASTQLGLWHDDEPQTIPMRQDEVRAFLIKYYGTDQNPQLELPLHTIPTRDRSGLVLVEGLEYTISDVGMRMLKPRELYRAQGFPDSYKIEIKIDGAVLTQASQVRMVGNSVSPPVARAIVAANFASEMEAVA